MTNGILASMKIRDSLFRKALKISDPIVKSQTKARYKEYRNRIVLICRQLKTSFYKNFFQENLHNATQIWKGINSIVSLKNSSTNGEITLNINGQMIQKFSTLA